MKGRFVTSVEGNFDTFTPIHMHCVIFGQILADFKYCWTVLVGTLGHLKKFCNLGQFLCILGLVSIVELLFFSEIFSCLLKIFLECIHYYLCHPILVVFGISHGHRYIAPFWTLLVILGP